MDSHGFPILLAGKKCDITNSAFAVRIRRSMYNLYICLLLIKSIFSVVPSFLACAHCGLRYVEILRLLRSAINVRILVVEDHPAWRLISPPLAVCKANGLPSSREVLTPRLHSEKTNLGHECGNLQCHKPPTNHLGQKSSHVIPNRAIPNKHEAQLTTMPYNLQLITMHN